MKLKQFWLQEIKIAFGILKVLVSIAPLTTLSDVAFAAPNCDDRLKGSSVVSIETGLQALLAETQSLSEEQTRVLLQKRWQSGGSLRLSRLENDYRWILHNLQSKELGTLYKDLGLIQRHLKNAPEELNTYLKLGIDPQVNLFPPDFETIYTNATLAVLELIRSGKLTPQDTILPGLAFYKLRDGEYARIFQNPLVQGWPRPEFVVESDINQMSDLSWVKSIANGIQPVANSPWFFMHDLIGHYTDLLQDPELMKWTRRNQTEVLRIMELPTKKSVWARFKPEAKAIEHFLNRNGNIREFCAIPKRSVPPEQLQKILSPDVEEAGQSIAHLFEAVLELHGGVLRDHNKIISADNYFPKLKILLNSRSFALPADVNGSLSTAIQETLWGYGKEIKILTELLYPGTFTGSPEMLNEFVPTELLDLYKFKEYLIKNPRQAAFLPKLYQEAILRFQSGFSEGLKLGITMSDIFKDSMNLFLDPNSKSYRFFKSYIRRQSADYELYIDQSLKPRVTNISQPNF